MQQEEEASKAVSASPKEPAKSQREGKRLTALTSSRIYISASYNNTLISVSNSHGDILTWSSAGALGFKGPKKATPYAAIKVVDSIFDKLGNIDLGKISVYVQGVGSGRDAALRALAGRGINIYSLKDKTPIAHNGCRPQKARRV